MEKIKLNWICFLNQSGYSQAAQNYIFSLEKTGYFDIKITTFGGRPSKPAISDEKYEFFMRMAKKKDNPERILIYHCIPNIQKRVKKKHHRSIGFATFETFQPPDHWVDILNENDAIIVPSQFNYKIFSHMTIKKPLYYIPHCIDIETYHRDIVPLDNFDKYTFLFIGIWKERKGYKQLLEAWGREFKDTDGVQLLVKTDKPKKAEQYFNKLRGQLGINKGFAPIIFENKVFNEKVLPNFIKSVDCLISPTMGEGFGYPGLQCMALGIPVIITNYAGCKDYANEDTAVLIEPSGFILHNNMDNIPQFRNKKWAFIEVNKIQKAMRYVINHKDYIKIKTDRAYSYVRERFNYSKISNMFMGMVKELYG